MKKVAPYGSWKSPISAQMIARAGMRLSEIKTDRDDVYWIEGRPQEGGRSVIVRRTPDGTISDVTPDGFNVRNAVHEYGGGSYAVHDGTVFFSNWSDQRIYRQRVGEHPKPLTVEPNVPRGLRYADLSMIAEGRYILCVRESHRDDGKEASNEIVAVDTASGDAKLIACGSDFYGSPRASDMHEGITWVEWDHPNMPWDGNRLVSASFDSAGLSVSSRTALTVESDESAIQPSWSNEGFLHFITDRTGWWNLHAWRYGDTINLLDEAFDAGGPDWQFGFSSYAFLKDEKIAIRRGGATEGAFVIIDPESGRTHTIEVPYSDISYVTTASDGETLLFVGSSPTQSPSIVQLDIASGETTVIRAGGGESVDEGYLSSPRHIVFPTTDGDDAHAWYYAPSNVEFVGPDDDLPPLIVVCHGGPTSFSGTGLDLQKQFWTSRGFALVDVNYRGSVGYGKSYRDALKGKWGIYDTDDCIAAAQHLIGRGRADKDRVVIRGGSAGGYTTINALTFHDFFAAGAALYGIADLMVFIGDTHKFESRYLDSLVGSYPEHKQRYHDRSAINFMDRLSTPMIILQGLEDEIVPPSQAEIMVDALEEKGLPYAYIGFEGEQHGFRQAETIIRAQLAELEFYGKVLKFIPADEIPADTVDIRNIG